MRVFWPLLSLLALLLLSQSFASANSGTQTGNENTVTVCEYQYSNLSSLNTTLSCPPNYSLQINRVNYGRLNESVCSANGFNDVTSCSYDGLSLVGSLCDGLQSCTFTPGYYFFGSNDPCPGFIKYTTIYYSCLPGSCTPVESGSSDNTVTWRYVYAQNNLTCAGNTTYMPDPPSDANDHPWYFPSFNDSAWYTGETPFGENIFCGGLPSAKTDFPRGNDLWLRKKFTIQDVAVPLSQYYLTITVDNNVESAYLNGINIDDMQSNRGSCDGTSTMVGVTVAQTIPTLESYFVMGLNILAIHVRDYCPGWTNFSAPCTESNDESYFNAEVTSTSCCREYPYTGPSGGASSGLTQQCVCLTAHFY